MFSLRVCDHLAARDATGGANRLHREIQIVATTIHSELRYPCCPCYAWAGSGGFAIVAFTRFHSTNPPNPRSLNLNCDRLIDCRLHVRVCVRACVRSAEHAHWAAGGERHNDCPAGSAGRRSRGRTVQALIAETKSPGYLQYSCLVGRAWKAVRTRSQNSVGEVRTQNTAEGWGGAGCSHPAPARIPRRALMHVIVNCISPSKSPDNSACAVAVRAQYILHGGGAAKNLSRGDEKLVRSIAAWAGTCCCTRLVARCSGAFAR